MKSIAERKIQEQSERYKKPSEAKTWFTYVYEKTAYNTAFQNGLPGDITDILEKCKGDSLEGLSYLMWELPRRKEEYTDAFNHYSSLLLEFVKRYKGKDFVVYVKKRKVGKDATEKAISGLTVEELVQNLIYDVSYEKGCKTKELKDIAKTRPGGKQGRVNISKIGLRNMGCLNSDKELVRECLLYDDD